MTAKKTLVSTDYAYRSRKSGLWWGLGDVAITPESYRGKTVAEALKSPKRYDVDGKTVEVVTGRWRSLSVKTKASKKRTR